MVKYYCDECKQEINRENQFEHVGFEVGGHKIELTWIGDRTTHDALCKYCVVSAVKRLDDRPREGE